MTPEHPYRVTCPGCFEKDKKLVLIEAEKDRQTERFEAKLQELTKRLSTAKATRTRRLLLWFSIVGSLWAQVVLLTVGIMLDVWAYSARHGAIKAGWITGVTSTWFLCVFGLGCVTAAFIDKLAKLNNSLG